MKTKVMVCTIVLVLSAFAGIALAGTEGNMNTFYGTGAGAGTTGDDDYDTFIGAYAGNSNTTGDDNTFLGYYAGFANTTGYENTFIGNLTGHANTTGYYNTFLGWGAGYSNTTGNSNIFLGRRTGWDNTTGLQNVFLGNDVGLSNTTGSYNTSLGTVAGLNNTTGSQNTFLGYGAGYSNTDGAGNVFLGYQAGFNETGSSKLYIHNSGTSTPLIYGEFVNRNLTVNGNLEVIGPYQGLVYLSNTTADNTNKVSRMVLNHYSNSALPVYLFGAASTATDNFVAFGGGNTIGNAATQIDLFTAENTTTPVGASRLTIIGNGYVGIGTQSPSNPLEMAGGAYSDGSSWINSSSRKYKDNIKGLKAEDAIETLQELNPVTFSYKVSPEEKRVGFIAEEVPELIATKDRKGLSPMDIVAVLTKVVQEQQKTISALTEELKELKEKVR